MSLQEGFKTWDKSYKSDAKLKVFKIDSLQCEIDLLKEELTTKDDQITKLQVELQQSQTPMVETCDDQFFDQQPRQPSQSLIQLENSTGDFEDAGVMPEAEYEQDRSFHQDFSEDVDDHQEQAVSESQVSNAIFSQSPDKLLTVEEEEQKASPTKLTEELRRDPEEEYFRLSVLSLKMLYNELERDWIFQISSKKMFKRCKKENVPFHHWYRWIDHELFQIQQKEK